MTNDTKNSLTDFDLCLALTQRAINSQLETAWKAWKRRKKDDGSSMLKDGDTLNLFKRKKVDKITGLSTIVEHKYGFKAKLNPLTISLNVDNAKLGQVEVTLNLSSGEVTYKDDDDEQQTELFENWSISFITDLNKEPINWIALQAIDPQAYEAAKKVIEKSTLPDSFFSIEYLFLEFTNINLLIDGNKGKNIPNLLSEQAQNQISISLNLLLKGEFGKFMLGTIVRRNNNQATPTFALTDFIFHVQPNKDMPDASTLSYLGMFENNKLPTNQNAARISLKNDWVDTAKIDGTADLVSGIMAISKKVFMDKYMIPKIQKELTDASLTYSDLTWTFKYDPEPEKSQEQGFSIRTAVMDWKYEKLANYYLEFALESGSPKINITGKIESYSYYDGYEPYNKITDALGFIPLGNLVVGSITGEMKLVSLVHIKGHEDISGVINLIGGGISTDFKLSPTLKYEFHGIAVDENRVEGYAAATDFSEEIFQKIGWKGKTYKQQLEEQQKNLANKLKTVLDEKLQNLSIELQNHAFIPPGGGVFTFQNPRFSLKGDLIFDVIYQAP